MAADSPKPRTKGRTIRNHSLAWAFVAIFPYFLVLMTAVFGHGDTPFGEWFGLSVFFLVGAVLLAAALCTLELGMLFLFSRSGAMGRTTRAVVPGVIIFLLALFIPSPTVTALLPPSAVSFFILVAYAAALGVGVFVSHSRYMGGTGRAGRVPRGMGPAGQD